VVTSGDVNECGRKVRRSIRSMEKTEKDVNGFF